ncbi:MAG: hypothetical protein V7609_1221 [Verrucomicrobiota bacterium]
MARMSFRRPISFVSGIRLAAVLSLLNAFVPAEARKKDPEFATSANDPVLRGAIMKLSPNVAPEEAQRIAQTAYTTGRDFKREWGVTWPPGFHNFLVNTGSKKGGLCFQWAEKLLLRLAEQKWETVEFHWAESFERSLSEHNVIVVTAKGQPLSRGILLDNWRYGGRLVWGAVIDDPHYQWHENKSQFLKVLAKRAIPVSSPVPAVDSAPPPKSNAQTR